MINEKLTQRPEKADFTANAVIHIAEPLDISQGPDGSSYKYNINRLVTMLSRRLDYGKIIKTGKGFTINEEGIYTPNTGAMSEHEKGDPFAGITPEGVYVPYMRYKGTGDVSDFDSFVWDAAFSAWLPGEPGYIEPEE